MKLLVGLGNPGNDYAATRHNIGFMAVDAIIDRFSFATPLKQNFQGECTEGDIEGEKIFALKPMTFMNESGRSVGEALRFYKLEVSDVIVIHDEIDLPFLETRVKKGGGHAGHNGLRSLDQHIGKEYMRIRLGVGHPGHKDRVSGHVLSPFSKEEQESLPLYITRCAAAFPLILKGDEKGFLEGVKVVM
jgi:PTH1 family peptidyl-tRNA hydrolase